MNDPRVLVVDDDDDFREVLMKRLSGKGLRVRGVDEGYKALEYIDKRDVDVMLLDMALPDLTGIDILRLVKERNPAIEVIMLTAQTTVSTGILCMKLGAFDYLMKPVPIDDLLDKIRQACRKKNEPMIPE